MFGGLHLKVCRDTATEKVLCTVHFQMGFVKGHVEARNNVAIAFDMIREDRIAKALLKCVTHGKAERRLQIGRWRDFKGHQQAAVSCCA